MQKLFIDSDECIGCDLCVELCSDLFTSSDFVPIVTEEDITNNKCARDAMLFCPTACIYIK